MNTRSLSPVVVRTQLPCGLGIHQLGTSGKPLCLFGIQFSTAANEATGPGGLSTPFRGSESTTSGQHSVTPRQQKVPR